MARKKRFYCYICAKPFDSLGYLVFYKKTPTDRVFLICEKSSCVDQVDRKIQETMKFRDLKNGEGKQCQK